MTNPQDYIDHCKGLIKPPAGVDISVARQERVASKGKCNGLHFTSLSLLSFFSGEVCIGSVVALENGGQVVGCIDEGMREHCKFYRGPAPRSALELLGKMHGPPQPVEPVPAVAAAAAAAAQPVEPVPAVAAAAAADVPSDFVLAGIGGNQEQVGGTGVVYCDFVLEG